MKRLSQTWWQKAKTTDRTAKNAVKSDANQASIINTASTDFQETPRRSQRLAKSRSLENVQDVLQDIKDLSYKNTASGIEQKGSFPTPSSSGRCSLLNSSFGFEFDADTLSAMDKMEKEHVGGKRRPSLTTGMPSTPSERSCEKMEVERDHLMAPMGTILKTSEVIPHNDVKTNPSGTRLCLDLSPNMLDGERSKEQTPYKLTSDKQTRHLLADKEKPSVTGTSNRATPNGGFISQTKISTQNSSSSSQACLTQEQCELTSWGLPDNILEQYQKIGITTMFEWQAQCLRTGNVLNGGNLVYSAPTSAGKTMVAEILTLKRVLETKCKALFILPFVSVAREKMFYMQRMFGEAGVKVDGYMGSQVPTKGFDSIDIAVCTIEKANGLVNRLMEAGQLQSVGAIVVDEMHLIGDTSRGYLLELLLTKVLYMSQRNADSPLERNVQIIGMSATLPNLSVLATWLQADLYFTNYRPVPLTENFKVGPTIYDRSGNVLRELSQTRIVNGDEDHVLALCQETIEEGNGVLVFCPTKSWCEKLAESIAKHFYTLGSTKMTEAKARRKDFVKASSLVMFDYEGLNDVFEQLRSCQVGLDNVLGKTLRYGVAYHHAGLTYDERDVIEAGFRQGIIKVLVATSTLSSGVNLPARRVIIRTPMFHGKLLDGLVYKQMSGRAGRKGVDSQGESILICKANEKQKARSLFENDLKPVESCLVVKRSDEDEGNGIKRALLEIIASGVATTPADVQRYASCTFYVSSKGQEVGQSTQNIIEKTVGFLEKNEFITLRKKKEAIGKTNSTHAPSYVPTQLGQATLASSLSPHEALVVFADLRKARKCFVLENELHILYQVTPIYVQDQWPNLDWYQYLRLWERLPLHMKHVAELVGVEERFLNQAMRGRAPARSEIQRHAHRVHKRFYVTMALHDLVHEVPLDTVARKYGASRGMLQSLQSSAATFSGMVTVFCRKLGWNNLEMLLSQFQNRLTFGIENELCDLVRISTLNAFRARVLYGAGYHTVAAIAAASPAEIEKRLRNATPFQSKKRSEGESDYELRRRMSAKCVWVKGGKALTESEAAQEIVKEACRLLKGDALKLGMTWKLEVAVSNEQDSTKTKKDVTQNQKAKGRNGDNNRKEESSEGFQECNATKTSTTSVTNNEKNLNKDHHVQNGGKENLSSGISPQKVDNIRHFNTALLSCNEQAGISKGPANTGEPNSLSCIAVTNSTASNIAEVASCLNNIDVNRNIDKTEDVVSNISPTPCFSVSTCTSSDIEMKIVEGKNRETPRKKRDNSLKLKHYVSKSPRDCNGRKMKLVDHDEHLGFRGKQSDVREAILDSPLRSKNDRKDAFFNDCLDNFRTKENACTPSKRKTKAVLLESSLSSPKSPSRKVLALVSNNKEYSSVTKKGNEVRSPVFIESSDTVKTPERKNTSSEHITRDHFDMSETNRATANKPRANTRPVNHNSISEEVLNLFLGNGPPSCNTETPIGKQMEAQDESPELITTDECNDTTSAPSKIPFTEIEFKTTSRKSLVTSPELYSEALFPDYESPRQCDQSFAMQVDKMSASIGFDNLDKSVQGLVVSVKDEGDKVSIMNEKVTNSILSGEVQTPGKVGDKMPAQEITDVADICTPGMFDSEFSQLTPILLDNVRPPHTDITDRQSPEKPRRNSDEIQRDPEQPQEISAQLPNSSEESRPSSAHSRRSSDSFSLRISQSFECSSDSDISTTTLAAVAAIEEDERIVKGNQDKKQYLIHNQDTDGSQRFQEFSNISWETLAAIEAMDDKLFQTPGNQEILRSCSNVEQGKYESRNADETRESGASHVTRFSNASRIHDESSSASKKHFTEVKLHRLPTKPINQTTEAKILKSPPVPISDAKKLFLKNTDIISNLPFEIINVAKDRDAFERFVAGCKSNSFSFSVAVEKRQPFSSNIGRKFNKGAKRSSIREKPRLAIEEESVVVVGVSVCWENRYVHFLSLEDTGERSGRSDVIELPFEERLDSLQCIMSLQVESGVKTAFAMKDQYKVLSQACGVILKGKLQDPKTANWLLDPGAKEKNFLQMVEHFLPQESNLLQGIISNCGHASLGQATQSSVSARKRSCLDAFFTKMLMDHIRPMLEADGLWQAFTKIEMPVISCLARMELNGFGFSNKECEEIKHVLRAKLRALEKEAYRLAHRHFSLTSPDDVSRVLFLELKLPPDGRTDVPTTPGKAVKPTRGGKSRKVKYFSTSKDVLEKLVSLHPLPKVVLEWRRINCALTKIVFPVQKELVHCDPPLNMSRIFSTALTHTVTGRVTFVEPNLQNVPKDFDINLPTVISDTPPTENLARAKRLRGKAALELYTASDDHEPFSPGPQFSVSLRSAFVPFSNGILVAADYSQLELRLIAHLSGDGKLAGFLNAGGDAFKMIAGEILHIAQDDVSDDQRQQAKHVCYGIIYGIGSKALGQTLDVDGNEAAAFVDAFKARFTGVSAYLKRTVDECRRFGYVTTISGRKRFLPNIRSSNAASRSQAERQAVNTTVQGSAADLVKLAMANIDQRMCEEFTNSWRTHRQKLEDELASRSPMFGKRVRHEQKFRGANLVLQLHDELLFEVVEEDFSIVLGIVREEMENAMKLSVKIPVKMKSGKSWGTMMPIE